MATIIKSNRGQIFLLFLTGTIEDGYDVLFVSGTRLWHNITKIDYDCRPASRKRDTKENFMHSLYVAFTQSNYQPVIGGRLFDYDLTVSDLDNQLSIVIKEQLAGTSTLSLLFKDTFISKDNSDEAMNQLWISHIVKMTTLEGEVKKKEMLLHGYKEDNKILIEKIQSLENDRYQNVTSLFNPLKRENQRLRQELEAGGNNKSRAGNAMEEEDIEELEDLPRAKKAATTKTTRKPTAKGKASSSAVDSILQKVKKASAATTKKPPAKRGRKAAALSSDEEVEAVDEASSTDMTEDEEAVAPPVPTIRAVSSKPSAATLSKREEEDDDDMTVMDSDEEEMFHAQPTHVWSMASVKDSYSFPSSSFIASTTTAAASSSVPITFAKNTFASSVSREDAESPVLSTKTNSFSQNNPVPVLASSSIPTLPPASLSSATASAPTTTTATSASAFPVATTTTTTTANPKKATRSNRFFEDSDDD
jgi:hypothetical protein